MPQAFRPRPSRGRSGRSSSSRSSSNGTRDDGGSNIPPFERQSGGWNSAPRRPRRRSFRIGPFGWQWKVMAFLVVIVGSFIMLVDMRVKPSIAAVAQSIARRAATEAVNDAVQSAVANSPDDGKILHVETDSGGHIRLASFDFHSISQIETDATTRSELTLTELSRETFALPISQTIGGPLLSVFTPELPVRVHLVGSAHSSIRMDVHSIGINQSVHALYLDIHAQVQAVAPLVTQPVDITTSVPLAYVVLNGEIPDTYVGTGDVGLPVLPPTSK